LQIEPAAVAAGAQLASTADHDAARAALSQLNAALARDDLASSGQLNRAFHLALIVPRLQPIAAEILGRLHTLAQRYIQAHLRPKGREQRARREHAALFRAWSAGHCKQVSLLTHAHIKATRDDLVRPRTVRKRG
jgi:DNA-binding GntR family transcriptional regulator